MGYNARNDEIRDNITRMRRDWAAQRAALATVRRFNASLSARGNSWFWPKIAAALVSKHHWLIIACDACDTVVDLDLRVKPRDPEASIRVALRGIVPAMQRPRKAPHRRVGAVAVGVTMLSLFGKPYFVAISLFVNVDKSREAFVDWKLPNDFDTYCISFRDGRRLRPIGWVSARDNPNGPAAFNEDMRNRRSTLALWRNDYFAGTFQVGTTIRMEEWDQLVQFQTIYLVHAWTTKKAAKEAWAMLQAGDPNHREWYDASPDRKWSALFGRP